MKTPIRIGAVSYLNTVPLIWGLLRGPQRGAAEVVLSLPSDCAEQLTKGSIDVGLVPTAELIRSPFRRITDLGIACLGTIRSILLITKVPLTHVRILAADAASRTSVALARIVLRDRYGVEPELISMPADLEVMMEHADAAVIIGDPALRLDPPRIPYRVVDLGQEWYELTDRPMVFAVWAARPELDAEAAHRAAVLLEGSYRFGRERLEQIIAQESARRGIPKPVARAYLTRQVVYELGPAELEGMELFLERVRQLEPVAAREELPK